MIINMYQGGAETFLMKLFRELDKRHMMFDFIFTDNNELFYEQEIRKLGGTIYRVTSKSYKLFKKHNEIKEIVNKNNYKVVFTASHISLSGLNLFASKKGGANKLIFRSTNTKAGGKLSKRILHYLFRPFANRLSNVKLAPSTEAAKHMFGKRYPMDKVKLVKNGIDTNLFEFNEESRVKIRKQLNVSDEFLIGHVGRFAKQKNHKYLIKVFNEVLKVKPNAKLLLIGKGPLKETVIRQAKSLGIYENIIIKEGITNMEEYYMAMDMLVFPSFYEGLPNVVVEAQATGLPCLISDEITNEVILTDIVKKISIKASPERWARTVLESSSMIINDRSKYVNKLREQGYDTQEVLNKMLEILS